MSALEMIANALAAGAGAGVTGVTSKAVEEAYAELKALVTRRRRVADTVAELEADRAPASTWQARLDAAGLDDGPEVVAVAQRLLELARQAPTYQVHLPGAQGVQFGDGNTQHNVFGS